MTSIYPDGSCVSDCYYCDWTSEPQHCTHDARVRAGEHARSCEARATYYAQVRSGVDPAARCHTCGGNNGAHGMVHARYGNGGGGNHPCPRA